MARRYRAISGGLEDLLGKILDIDTDNIIDMDETEEDEVDMDMDEIMEGVVDIEKEYSIDSDDSLPKGDRTQIINDEKNVDNKSKVQTEKVELHEENVIESKANTTKKRVDSRNNGVRVSKKLGEKLGRSNTDTVNYLVSFNRMLEAELSLSSCSEDMHKAVSEKMVGLTDLVAKIYKVTKSHISNDKKKEKIEELVGDLDIIKFTVDLRSEISATKETLIKKAREAAKNINDKIVSDTKQSQENINIKGKVIGEDKEYSDAEKEFDADKRSDGKEDKEEKAMIKHEKTGFFGKIKRFFTNIKESHNNKKDRKISGRYLTFDEDPLVEPQKESESEYIKAGFGIMEKIKDILKAAIEGKNSREVTPDSIESIAERTATFSQDKKITARCKEITNDVWAYINAMSYAGGYVVPGVKSRIETIRDARRGEGMDR